MVRIFTYIYHKNQPNVGECTIYGWYGLCKQHTSTQSTLASNFFRADLSFNIGACTRKDNQNPAVEGNVTRGFVEKNSGGNRDQKYRMI